MNLKEHIEKATKEFVYPATPGTPEEIEFVVTPILEAIADRLTEKIAAAELELKEIMKTNPAFRTHLNGEIFALNSLLAEVQFISKQEVKKQ